jgi:site-specific recombinase XerD
LLKTAGFYRIIKRLRRDKDSINDGPIWKAFQIKVEYNAKPAGAMAESADATDLKSVGGDTVRVRPPLAPLLHLFLISKIKKEIRDMNTTQRTSLQLLQEDYLELCIESFLVAKKSENLTESSIKYYREKLSAFIAYCLNQEIKVVSQITASTIREYLIHLGTTHNSGGVHGYFRSLKAFLRWYENEYEPENWHNPIKKIKSPRVDQEALEPANIEDVEKMIASCDTNLTGRRDKALMYFLLDTGLRANELLRIKLSEINLMSGEVLIAKSKSRHPRFVFLGDISRRAMRKYLKMRKDDCPYLWVTNSGTKLSYWGLRTAIEYRAERAGVKAPSIHSFRRYWGLAMLNNGKTDLITLSRLGGWSDLQILKDRYAKQNKEDWKAKSSSTVDDLE